MKLFLCTVILQLSLAIHAQSPLPKGFIYLTDSIPHIASDLRYCGHDNFVGTPVKGYNKPRLISTKALAIALMKAEKELNQKNLGFKIFDAYRPQAAVDHFKKWASNPNDTLTKTRFYPDIDKRLLFKLGYIASKSAHSRGSTIDLTLIDLKTKEELDMGTPFDFLGPQSAHDYPKITSRQKQNRKQLKNILIKYGFKPYAKEWWHYTLVNEPFKETYFNFPVQ